MLASSATATSETTSELPPNEMNGIGTPVTGHDDVTTPTLMNACTQIMLTQPIASKKPKRSGAASAMRIARCANTTKSTTISAVPSNPSSSPMIEKMKSVYCSGR